MAPEIFIKAYARATPEEYQLSEEAPKIDAKNPAGIKTALLPLFVCHGSILSNTGLLLSKCRHHYGFTELQSSSPGYSGLLSN